MIKTTKTMEQATVLTHGGVFHADEVLATVILSKVLEDITVLRTFKVPEGLSDDVIVYDIGFGRFDHHQKGGNGARENGVPYASVGLIWKEYGHQIVENTANPELVWELIDRDLIQGVDATDNGAMPKPESELSNMSFSNIISGFNPTWDSNEDSDEAFIKAVEFAETVFENTLKNATAKAKAQKIVEEAIEKSQEHIMVLEQFVPWQEFVFSSENAKASEVQFVVFPSNRGGYNWQCVPDMLGGFGQRKTVPSEWRGLSGENLQKVTGVPTANFCHAAGFLGSAETFEDAYALAKLAVEA